MPHLATDPIQIGTKIIEAFQNIVAREINSRTRGLIGN